MKTLNPEQQFAVETRSGAFNCTAIPGSGKTEVFSRRAKDILKAGCDPRDFLGLTFTKEAALEFELRSGYKPGPTKPKIFRTFHGFALDFVTSEYQSFPFRVQRFPLITPQEQYSILGPIVRHAPRRIKYRDLTTAISNYKRKTISPEQALREATGEFTVIYARLYGTYEEKCKNIGKLDFDSLMVETVKLLESDEKVRQRWQLQYVQNDEAQDNDSAQWRLVQLLSQKQGNVFCVGDPNQNMYTWRGAEPEGLTVGFDRRFPNHTKLVLPQNYRSTKAIVAYCESIAPVPTPMRTDNPDGTLPTFKAFLLDEDEAKAILMNLTEPTETAILARTNRQLSAFERVCGENKIKYKLLGKSGFFNQEEVQNTLAFAQYFVSPTDASIKQIIRSPYESTRFIRKGEAIDVLENLQRGTVGYAPFYRLLPSFRHEDSEQTNRVLDLHRKLEYTASLIKGKSAENALRNILAQFGILHHYEDDADVIDNSPADNVRTLLKMAEKHSSLLLFVNTCLKAKAASRSTAKRLTLSTIHQAKGKEWRNVFVVGVNEGVLPNQYGDFEEERRIYFVACSRAAVNLAISCFGSPSSYIKAHILDTPQEKQVEVDALDLMFRNSGAK